MGLLQNQLTSVDDMIKQHKTVVRSRASTLEKQKCEMDKLEGECAILALKINEAALENLILVSDIKRLNKTELPSPSPFARRNSRARVAQCLEEIIVFLADKNIMALKEQLLFCVQKLQKDLRQHPTHSKRLANLEVALSQQPVKKLNHESSLEGSLLNPEENIKQVFINSSSNFVPAPTLNLSNLGPHIGLNSDAIRQAKEIISNLPIELLLLLVIEYYCRLRDGCLKKHNQFANLHQKWGYGLRTFKDIKKGLVILQKEGDNPHDRDISMSQDWNPRMGSMIAQLEKSLETIFRIKIFGQTFALRVHKLICKINSCCAKLRFTYQMDISCPFLHLNESLLAAGEYQDCGIDEQSGKAICQMSSLNFNFEVNALNWLKSRIPFLRLASTNDLRASIVNQRGSSFNRHTAIFQQFYDQVINEMRAFSAYLNEIASEAKGERNTIVKRNLTREIDQSTADFRRSTTNPNGRREQKTRTVYKNFAENIPPISLRNKVLLQNQSVN